ncbi:MAG: hypothetical protein ACXIUB_05390 [Wenzhouxiangella sp.]
MASFSKRLPVAGLLLVSLLLTGCQDSGNNTNAEAGSAGEQGIDSPLAQPASPPRRAVDPAQVAAEQAAAPADRDALRERVREERERRVAESTTESRRAMVRQRQLLADGQWWREASLADSLSLSSEQAAALDRAFEAEAGRREQDARRLLVARRSLNQALTAEDRLLALDQLANIEAARTSIARGQTAWLTTLIETLNDQQLAELAGNYPQLLLGRDADSD